MTSTNDFLNLILAAADKNSRKYIETFVRICLVSLIKTADSDARQLFFPDEKRFDFDRVTLLANEELSTRYLLYIISGSQQIPDIAQLVKEKSYDHVSSFLSFHAESIGEMIYLLYLQMHVRIAKTSGERGKFFNNLTHQLIYTNYTAVTKAVSISHSPAPAQLIISALKLMDSSAYNKVLHTWAHSEFFLKKFADLDLFHLLEHYPWLESYHADVLSEEFTSYITNAARDNAQRVKEWTEKSVLRYGLF